MIARLIQFALLCRLCWDAAPFFGTNPTPVQPHNVVIWSVCGGILVIMELFMWVAKDIDRTSQGE